MQLQIMLEAFASVRTDTDAWAQFVLRGREYLAQQLQQRIGFDPSLDAQVGGEEAGNAASDAEGDPVISVRPVGDLLSSLTGEGVEAIRQARAERRAAQQDGGAV